MIHRYTVIFGILLLAAAAAGPAPAGPYYVTDLGVLAGGTGTTSHALAVNDYGVVAGSLTTSTAGNSISAAVYTGGAGTTSAPLLASPSALPTASPTAGW